MTPPPPLTALADLQPQLASAGWAVLDAASLARVCRPSADDPSLPWARWQREVWSELPPDPHLRDGGRYRRRRHGSLVVAGDRLDAVAHRAHWQPVEYNALHGGFERWFEPLPASWMAEPEFGALLRGLGRVASGLRGEQPWSVEVHPFRIDTAGGIGRPTPEGAHRDGVDLVAVVLVGREGVKGGETRVFDARGPQGVRFTLREPGSVLLLDDTRVVHETTPIQPDRNHAAGHRDTLVLTYRAGGFQGPAAV
jgi:hypothetical protein